MTPLFPLFIMLASSSPGAVVDVSPGCEDDQADTPCCPLENSKFLSATLRDWYACTETVPPAPLPLSTAPPAA